MTVHTGMQRSLGLKPLLLDGQALTKQGRERNRNRGTRGGLLRGAPILSKLPFCLRANRESGSLYFHRSLGAGEEQEADTVSQQATEHGREQERGRHCTLNLYRLAGPEGAVCDFIMIYLKSLL